MYNFREHYPEFRVEPMATPPSEYYSGNNFYGGKRFTTGSYSQSQYSSNPTWSTHVIGTAISNVFSGSTDDDSYRWKNHQSNNFFGSSSQDQRSFNGFLPMSYYSSFSDSSYRDPSLRNSDFRVGRNILSSSSHSSSSFTGTKWDCNQNRPSYANNDGHMGYEEQTNHFIRNNKRVITSREEMKYSHTIKYDERHIKKIVKKVIKKHVKEEDFNSKKRRESEIDKSQTADSKYTSTNDFKNTRNNKSEKTSTENFQKNPKILNTMIDTNFVKDMYQNSSNVLKKNSASSVNENKEACKVIENGSSICIVDLIKSHENDFANSIVDLTKPDENTSSICIDDLTNSNENGSSNCKADLTKSDCSPNCKVDPAKSDCSSNYKVDPVKSDCSSNCKVDPAKSDCSLNCKFDPAKSDCSSNCKVDPAKSDCSLNCKVDPAKSDCSSNCKVDPAKSDCSLNCKVDPAKSDCSSNCKVDPAKSDCSSNCKVDPAKSDCSSNCKIDPIKCDGSSNCKIDPAKSDDSSNCKADFGSSNSTVDPVKADGSSNCKVDPAKSYENGFSNSEVDLVKSDEKNYKSREDLQDITQLVNISDHLYPNLTTSTISQTFDTEEHSKSLHEKNHSLGHKVVGLSENHTDSNKVGESITITNDKEGESLDIAETNNIEMEIERERMIIECDFTKVNAQKTICENLKHQNHMKKFTEQVVKKHFNNLKYSNIAVVFDEKSLSAESKSGVVKETNNSRNENNTAEDYIAADEQFIPEKENTNYECKLQNKNDQNNKEKRNKSLLNKKRKHVSINNKYCMVVNGKSVYRAQKYYRKTEQDQSIDAELGIDEFHKEYYRNNRYCSDSRFRCRDNDSFGGHCIYANHTSHHLKKNTAFINQVENNIQVDANRRRFYEKTLHRLICCDRQKTRPVYENWCSHRDIVHPMCRYHSARQITLNKKCHICHHHSSIGCKENHSTQSPFGLGEKCSHNDGQCCLDQKSIQHNGFMLNNGLKENQEKKNDPIDPEQTSNGNIFPISNETKKSLEKMLRAALNKIIPSLKKTHNSNRIKKNRRGILQKLKVQKRHRLLKGHKVQRRQIKEANQCEEKLGNNVSVSCLEDPDHDDNNTKHSYESDNLKITKNKSNKVKIKQNNVVGRVQSTKVDELADSNIPEDIFDHTYKIDSPKFSDTKIRSSLVNCNGRSIKELNSEPDGFVGCGTENNEYKNMKGSKEPNLKVSIDLSLIESGYGLTKETENILLKQNKNSTCASLSQNEDSEIKFATYEQEIPLHTLKKHKESDFSRQSLQKEIPDSSVLFNDLKFLKRKSTSPLHGFAKKGNFSKEESNHESTVSKQIFKIKNTILDSKFNESFKKNRRSLDPSNMKTDANPGCHPLKSILKRRSSKESETISMINTIPQKYSTYVDWKSQKKLSNSNGVVLGNDISCDLDFNDKAKDSQESKVISIEYKKYLKKTGVKHVTFHDSITEKHHSPNVNDNYYPETESVQREFKLDENSTLPEQSDHMNIKYTNEKMSANFSRSTKKTDFKDEIITNKCKWGPQKIIKLGENIVEPQVSTITASKITKGKQRVSRIGSTQTNIKTMLNDSNRSKTNLTLEQYLQQKQNSSQTSTGNISKIDSKEMYKNSGFSSIKDFILKQSESQNIISSPKCVQGALNNQRITKSKMTPSCVKNETGEDVERCVSVNNDNKYSKCLSTPIVSSTLNTSNFHEEPKIDNSSNDSIIGTTSLEVSKKVPRRCDQSIHNTSTINFKDQWKTKTLYKNVRKTKLYKKPAQKTNQNFKPTGSLYISERTKENEFNVNDSYECFKVENSPIRRKKLPKFSYKIPKTNRVNKSATISNNENYTTISAYEQNSSGISSKENKKITININTTKEKEKIKHDQNPSKKEFDEHSRLTVSYSSEIPIEKINNVTLSNNCKSVRKEETQLNQEFEIYKSCENSRMTASSKEVSKNNKIIIDIKTFTSTKETKNNDGPKTARSHEITKVTKFSSEVLKKQTDSTDQFTKKTFNTTIKEKTNHDLSGTKKSCVNSTKTFSSANLQNELKISNQTSNNNYSSIKMGKPNTNEKYNTNKSPENARIVESSSDFSKKRKYQNSKIIRTRDEKEKNHHYQECRSEKSRNSTVSEPSMALPLIIRKISNESSNNICTSNKKQICNIKNRQKESLKTTRITVSLSGVPQKLTKLINQTPKISSIFEKKEVDNNSKILPSDNFTNKNCTTQIQDLNCEIPSQLNVEQTSSIESQIEVTTMLTKEKTAERFVSISKEMTSNSCSIQPINRDACMSYTNLIEPDIALSDSTMDNKEDLAKIEILVGSCKQEPQVSKHKCANIVSSIVNQKISIDTNNDISHKLQEVDIGLEKTGDNVLYEEEPGDKHQEWTEDYLSKSFKIGHESQLLKLPKTILVESTANKKTKNNSQFEESTVSILPGQLHKQRCLSKAQLDYENQRKEELANCPLLTSVLNSVKEIPKASVTLRILTPGEIDQKFIKANGLAISNDAIEKQKSTHIDEIISQVSISSNLEVYPDKNSAHLPVNNRFLQHARVYTPSFNVPTIEQTLNYNPSLNSGPSSKLSAFDNHNTLARTTLDSNPKPSKPNRKFTKKTTPKQPPKKSQSLNSECYEYTTVCTSDPITWNQLGQENDTVCERTNFSDSFIKYLTKWNNHMDYWRTDIVENNQQAAPILRTHRHSTGNKYIQNQYTVPTQNNENNVWLPGQHFTPYQTASDETESTNFESRKEIGMLPNTQLAYRLHGNKTVDINRRNSYPQMKPTYQTPENQWQISAVPSNSLYINGSIRAPTDFGPLTSNNGISSLNNFHVPHIQSHQSFLQQNINAEILQTNISQTNQTTQNVNEINSNNYGEPISQFRPVYQNQWPDVYQNINIEHQLQRSENDVCQNSNIQTMDSFNSPNHQIFNEGNYKNVSSEVPCLLNCSQNLTCVYNNSLSQSQNNTYQHFREIENGTQVDQFSNIEPHASNLLTRRSFLIDTLQQDSNGQSYETLQYLPIAEVNTLDTSPCGGNPNAVFSQNNTSALETIPISLKKQMSRENFVGETSPPAKRVQSSKSIPESRIDSSSPPVTYPNDNTTRKSVTPPPRAKGSLGKEAWVLKYLNSRKQSTDEPTLDSSLKSTEQTVFRSYSPLYSNSVLDTVCINSLSSSGQAEETSSKVISYSTVKEQKNDCEFETLVASKSEPVQPVNETDNRIRAQQKISSMHTTISESHVRALEYDCRVLLSPIDINLQPKTNSTNNINLVKSTKSNVLISPNYVGKEIDEERYIEIITDDSNDQYREKVSSSSQKSPTNRSELNTVSPDIHSPANHLGPITVQTSLISSSQSTFEIQGIKALVSSNRNMRKNKFYNMYNPCFLLMSELRQCANLEERDDNTLNNALQFIAGIINELFVLKVEQNWDIDSPGFRKTVKKHATKSKVSLILILSYYQDDIYRVLHENIKNCEGFEIKEFLDVKRTLLELMWSARNIELGSSDYNELVELMARYKKLAIDAI